MKKSNSPLDFQKFTNYNYLHNTNQEKVLMRTRAILLRFAEREGKAETFLTREIWLTTSELQLRTLR